MSEKYKYGEKWKISKGEDDDGRYVKFDSDKRTVKIYKNGEVIITDDSWNKYNYDSETSSTNSYTEIYNQIYKPFSCDYED